MPFSLKNHPFAVEAFFEQSTVLTYALPKAQLQPLIPPCLGLDTYLNEWAFVAVAMVQTKHLRPKGFPEWLGNDFFLIGYRIFVTYHTSAGKRLRGLYIMRSQTDKPTMTLLGNMFTHYNHQLIDVAQQRNDTETRIVSRKAALDVRFHVPDNEPLLPTDSPFPDWKIARRYAGPLPFTFACNVPKREVLIIEGVRENWTPTPIVVAQHQVGFLPEMGLENAILASAFAVQNIPYSWKKGRIDQWMGN